MLETLPNASTVAPEVVVDASVAVASGAAALLMRLLMESPK